MPKFNPEVHYESAPCPRCDGSIYYLRDHRCVGCRGQINKTNSGNRRKKESMQDAIERVLEQRRQDLMYEVPQDAQTQCYPMAREASWDADGNRLYMCCDSSEPYKEGESVSVRKNGYHYFPEFHVCKRCDFDKYCALITSGELIQSKTLLRMQGRTIHDWDFQKWMIKSGLNPFDDWHLYRGQSIYEHP
ncbi:hypothetical protein [Enterovibrio norvegicus]|uniref:hypothetical protein n=1 Tax=Enterovibrio norvegicus TaxID=188144 RepID=UPI0013D188B6|nr:hypothetical protein [Enterovibrio norvegicus]